MSSSDSFHSVEGDGSENESFMDAFTLRDILINEFSMFPKNFNVCHINAQSIAQHYSDLLDTFNSNSIHVVLVSESWLKPSLPSTSYSLPGFILLRNDREGPRAGGVAIYLRSYLSYTVLSASPSLYSASPEYLFLQIDLNGKKLLLGVVYSPPSIDYFSKLENLLETLVPEYTHHVIMGDFNTCLLKDTPDASKLRSLMRSVNLHILPSNATHHNIDTPDTLLDLMLTSCPDLISVSGQHPAPAFSRHDLLFLSYKIKPPKIRPVMVRRRDYSRMDVERLKESMLAVDWTPLFDAEVIDDKVAYFSNKVIELYDSHAPYRTFRVSHAPTPWITDEVRVAMSRRDRAFRKFKADRTETNWSNYRSARNKCNQMCRNTKRRFIHSNVTNVSPSSGWKFLRTLGIGKSTSQHTPTIPLNDLNRHFSSSSSLDICTKISTFADIAKMPRPVTDTFSFTPVDSDGIKKIVLSIKSGAMGCDDIDRAMIVHILDELLLPLSHIVNCSLSLGKFPSSWRNAFVCPLPKVSSPVSARDYRPISVLPFLSKILEIVVHQQFSSFLTKFGLLNPLQSGFTPGHSTATALTKVTDDFRGAMDGAMVTVLVLIDFSNAFNTVDPDLLIAILSTFNLASPVIDWFSSYLHGRRQAVRVGQDCSDWLGLQLGVPQGGILSPQLFSTFVNLVTPLLSSSYHLYADDLQIYRSTHINDIDNCIELINQDLDRIQGWSERFGLQVNPCKCQSIIIGSSRQLSLIDTAAIPPVVFNGNSLPLCAEVKDLGLVIDANLSWVPQVSEVCRKVYASLHYLHRLKNFLPVNTKISLVQSLLLPTFDYADVCYPDLSEDLLNKLDRLLNTCIRFIFNLRKYDHISQYRAKLKWLPIRQRRHLRILLLLFSILKDPCAPSYLKDNFKFLAATHSRELRSSDTLILDIPAHRTSFLSSSFSVTAVRLWNRLPVDVRKAGSKPLFRRLVHEHLLASLS